MATKYVNTPASQIHSSGGAVRVTLVAGVGRGNGGTSLPCCGCFVSPVVANKATVRMNIGVAASATVGIDLGFPSVGARTTTTCQPIFVPVDDVSSLFFFSTQATAVVDILYVKG